MLLDARLAYLRYEHETCILAARSVTSGQLAAIHLNRAAEARRTIATVKGSGHE